MIYSTAYPIFIKKIDKRIHKDSTRQLCHLSLVGSRQFRVSISCLSRFHVLLQRVSRLRIIKRRYRRSPVTTGVYELLRNDFLNSTWRINADVKSRARIKDDAPSYEGAPLLPVATFFSAYLSRTNRPRGLWHVGDSGDFLAATCIIPRVLP